MPVRGFKLHVPINYDILQAVRRFGQEGHRVVQHERRRAHLLGRALEQHDQEPQDRGPEQR